MFLECFKNILSLQGSFALRFLQQGLWRHLPLVQARPAEGRLQLGQLWDSEVEMTFKFLGSRSSCASVKRILVFSVQPGLAHGLG